MAGNYDAIIKQTINKLMEDQANSQPPPEVDEDMAVVPPPTARVPGNRASDVGPVTMDRWIEPANAIVDYPQVGNERTNYIQPTPPDDRFAQREAQRQEDQVGNADAGLIAKAILRRQMGGR